MKFLKFTHLFWQMCVFFIFYSCENQTEQVEPFGFKQPAHFPKATYNFQKKPVTKAGFELGRKLFFDPNLSSTGEVSCSNCHQQGNAFADGPHHPLSIGINGKNGTRNAPSLANMAFFKEFMWDGGINHLDFVPINALTSDIEMGEKMGNLVKMLNNDANYPTLFKNAFGIDTATATFMLVALSQFTLMMVSDNSPYDQYLKGEKEALNSQQIAGMKLFKQKCEACHTGVLQTDFSYRNNGISEKITDKGRGRISEHETDYGKFRVPSLRNVALTPPYMHDAKFNTLEEVLDHYSNGIKKTETLDPLLKDGIKMNSDEKQKIIAFLKSLTDEKFLRDARFRNAN